MASSSFSIETQLKSLAEEGKKLNLLAAEIQDRYDLVGYFSAEDKALFARLKIRLGEMYEELIDILGPIDEAED